METSVYIETTIPSYLAARPSRDVVVAGKQETTREWWEKVRYRFNLYISDFVLDESKDGNEEVARRRLEIIREIPILEADDFVESIAKELIARKAIPEQAQFDALHIAIATRHGIDYLLTWNCRHIANAQTMKKIETVVLGMGYELPLICTPDELMETNSYE